MRNLSSVYIKDCKIGTTETPRTCINLYRIRMDKRAIKIEGLYLGTQVTGTTKRLSIKNHTNPVRSNPYN